MDGQHNTDRNIYDTVQQSFATIAIHAKFHKSLTGTIRKGIAMRCSHKMSSTVMKTTVKIKAFLSATNVQVFEGLAAVFLKQVNHPLLQCIPRERYFSFALRLAT